MISNQPLITGGTGSDICKIYTATGIGVCNDASGVIDLNERTVGGYYNEGADTREDWLVINFQGSGFDATPTEKKHHCLIAPSIKQIFQCNPDPATNYWEYYRSYLNTFIITEEFDFDNFDADNPPSYTNWTDISITYFAEFFTSTVDITNKGRPPHKNYEITAPHYRVMNELGTGLDYPVYGVIQKFAYRIEPHPSQWLPVDKFEFEILDDNYTVIRLDEGH